jgi:NAD dependent epimerase/dehydratase family enzyme
VSDRAKFEENLEKSLRITLEKEGFQFKYPNIKQALDNLI